MTKKGGLAIAVLLVVTGALRWMSPGGSPPQSAGEQAEGKVASPKLNNKGPKDAATPIEPFAVELAGTIQEFFGLDHDDFAATQKNQISPTQSTMLHNLLLHWSVPAPERRKVRFLIALLPDPAHTQLNLFFDRGVETIQQAAQEQSYDFDRAIMPWDISEHPESSDYKQRGQEAATKAARESYPGLMIFRPAMQTKVSSLAGPGGQTTNAGDTEIVDTAVRSATSNNLSSGEAVDQSEPGPLFVFVVGETPTAGIHKDQFANALQIICDIQDCENSKLESPKSLGSQASTPKSLVVQHSKDAKSAMPYNPGATPDLLPLLILGPTSSGSLYSLWRNLELNKTLIGDHPVLVFSGTARGTAQHCWFQQKFQDASNEADRRKNENGQRGEAALHVRLVPFQDGEDDAIRKFLTFAKDRRYDSGDIAILSEDETSYGDISEKSETPSDNSQADRRCVPGYGWEEKTTKLQFPRGISQFRSAYQKQISPGEAQDAGNQQRPVLPLDLRATGTEDDSVETYAKAQFPLSQEAVMLGIVARLHSSHPRFVILRASDPVDQLFLTRYLRQNYPQGRVVVTAPDLLYTREDDGLLHGVLGISAYSLAPEASHYLAHGFGAFPRNPRPERAFPGSSEQGTYDAMVALLAIAKKPSEDGPLFDESRRQKLNDLPKAPYSRYGSFRDWRWDDRLPEPDGTWECQNCQLAPALWISILARDGYWLAYDFPPDAQTSLHTVDDRPAYGNGTAKPRTPKSWTFVYAVIVFFLFIHTYLIWSGNIFSASEIKARFGYVEARDPGRNPFEAAQPIAPFEEPTDAAATLAAESARARAQADAQILAKFKEPSSRKNYVDESKIYKRRRVRLLAWGTASLASVLLILIGVRYAGISRQEGPVWTQFLLLFPLGLTAAVSRDLWLRRGEVAIAARLFAGVAILGFVIFLPGLGPLRWLSTLTAYRSLHLTSGVSPLVPFLLLIAAFYCLSWYELQALSVTDGRRPRLPCAADLPPGYYRVSEEDVAELRGLAASLSIPKRVFVPILFFLAPMILLTLDYYRPHPVQTIEAFPYDWLYFFFLLFWLFLFLGCLSRLIGVWNECRRFLMGLDNLPLRDALKNMQDFSWTIIWSPSGSALRDSYKYVSRELQGLHRLAKTMGIDDANEKNQAHAEFPQLAEQVKVVFALQRLAEREYHAATQRPAHTSEDPDKIAVLMETYANLQKELGKTAGRVLKDFLQPSWSKIVAPVASDFPTELAEKKTPQQLIAEEFVALVYANFLTTVLLRVRTLVMEAIGIFLCLLFSISSYPFEPNPDMFTLAVALIVIMGVVIAYVYSQMHRDPALSRLTSTQGELGLEFWGQFLAAGALPVLSLLAVQFPAISRVLTSLLGPAVQSLK